MLSSNDKKGFFITLEGIEGVGKSTNLQFLQTYLREQGIDLLVTREPGGTNIAEAIRQILLTPFHEPITDMTELLLIFAARSQHLTHVILPALAQGRWVLCDRFTDTTYAYQGYGRAIALEKIAALETWVQDTLRPDLVLLLDAPVAVALKRAKRRLTAPDRIEAEQQTFFENARQGYLERASAAPAIYRIIDAAQPKEQVKKLLGNVMQELFYDSK